MIDFINLQPKNVPKIISKFIKFEVPKITEITRPKKYFESAQLMKSNLLNL